MKNKECAHYFKHRYAPNYDKIRCSDCGKDLDGKG